uniref:Uncharacterized protein n=1 Tax=Oryza sativa subsp. japonica TaxID=39947 RepID=Q6YVT9_ORYSJ|nr:hypothetical protein [Oryza sativa Japonica Group]BAD10654.1 hypothetical protein [Oryza sativa Japonica Group]
MGAECGAARNERGRGAVRRGAVGTRKARWGWGAARSRGEIAGAWRGGHGAGVEKAGGGGGGGAGLETVGRSAGWRSLAAAWED